MSTVETPNIKNVSGIQFSILGPDEIRKRSVVEITKHDTYEKDVPVIKGIFDPRMGVTDMGKVCKTCGQRNINCPGHFGHVELARPVYNYHFVQTLIKILKCVCFRCSKLLVDKDNVIIQDILKKPPKQRFQEIYSVCQKINRCGQETEDGCGCKQPENYKLDGLIGIQAKWKKLDIPEGLSEEDIYKLKNQLIDIEYIKQLLEKISDEDAKYMGFSELWCRPEWLICSVLPVPPPCVRPSVKQDNSQRMDDDLTHKLADIIKTNNILAQKIDKESRIEVIDDWTKVLQYHVATLVDNDIPGIAQSAHRSGRVLKSIRQRLKGKDGRIRNNLMGKRVDFSARSVITPDPNIGLDELGVPFKIASNLTYPEIVNKFNMEKLLTIVRNGDKWPGCKSIVKTKEDNRITIGDNNKDTIELEYGDIVHRHLMDGDWVLFNRQPSLHKMSMMGHRVRCMEGNTFRLNVSVTPPYNADFDGDEMNMHAPQSNATVIELKEIMNVTRQIISPRENKPIITIVQDTLLGINRLTRSLNFKYIVPNQSGIIPMNNTNNIVINVKNTDKPGKIKNKIVDASYFTRTQIQNILCDLSTFGKPIPKPEIIYDNNGTQVELWVGRQVLSYILPDNINLNMCNDMCDDDKDIKNFVKITEGLISQGAFDKGLFTKTSKGLIHTIFNDLGPDRATDFINDLQKIITYFLLIEGFSVGISDMIADKSTNRKIKKIINGKKKEIDDIMQELHLNIFENYTGQSNNDYFESKVNGVLNKTLAETGKVGLSSLSETNRAINMINSGSKGKATNIAQMVACLGQQNVDGSRIPNNFNDRTLPHYYKYDDSSEARGFVENSFISGQTPQEYFFHAMGGREGLIDTAVKTSETGYIQRKLMKAMEDLKVSQDYSVRTSSNTIIQFTYGGDGMDATFTESQPLLIGKLDTESMIKTYLFEPSYNWEKYLDKACIKELKSVKKYQEKLQDVLTNLIEIKEYLVKDIYKYNLDNNILFPIHFERLTTNLCGLNPNNKSTISPFEILENNEKLKKQLYITKEFKNNTICNILIDINLSPKLLIHKYRITKENYYKLIDTIKYTYNRSKICPGEMVGAVAAQSIGEPATQMTLNTFHYAGVSAKSNVTRGIPRLRELLHITKNLKSPSVQIYLKSEYKEKQDKCNYIKNQLEYTKLSDIIVNSEIHYDPNNNTYDTNIESDKEFLSIYKEFINIQYGDDPTIEYTSPWIIRFTFNKELMLEKGIIMEDIYLAIMDYDPERIDLVYSDENSNELIGRISIKSELEGVIDENMNGLEDQADIISIFKNIKEELLENVAIKGIENITNIVMSQIDYNKKENNELINTKQWLLESDGTNLIDIIANEYVDPNTTISNDIIEIYELLGIEAARNILVNEIKGVVEYEGSYINNRHIELLCEVMTSTGRLISINRQGIQRGDIGPLAKCSFEDTTDMLIKAGIFGEMDKLNGVSSNIMMGQKIHAGTNNCEILIDEYKLMEQIKNMNKNKEDLNDINEITETNIDKLFDQDSGEDDSDCDYDNFTFACD